MPRTVIDCFEDKLKGLCMEYGVDLEGYAVMQIDEDTKTEFEVNIK